MGRSSHCQSSPVRSPELRQNPSVPSTLPAANNSHSCQPPEITSTPPRATAIVSLFFYFPLLAHRKVMTGELQTHYYCCYPPENTVDLADFCVYPVLLRYPPSKQRQFLIFSPLQILLFRVLLTFFFRSLGSFDTFDDFEFF
ncbi:hypothetical protein P3L10_015523 [Capsicum annuum]|uniref:uncharacterized protein LOC124898891 n=1 Tax=Capsicum annuum TaxID=4072 RepID=UPI001FB06617|nr:uncharacterized protein LOC124898891 [Capsicum annuum]